MIKKILKAILIVIIVVNVLAQIGLMLSNATFNIIDIYAHPIPKKDKIVSEYKESYLINKVSYFENQGLNQCAGYSTAYLLRTNNYLVSGDEVYTNMNYKFGNGYVLPRSIISELNDRNISVTLYKGNIDQLKTRLNNDNPLIVLIGDGVKWQHYVNVVGYDNNNIYLYDSLISNSSSHKYNRVLTTEEFEKLWNNGLGFFSKTYIYIDK